VVEALKHEDLPFPLLVEQLGWPRDPARPPIFQVAFNFQLAGKFGGVAQLFSPSEGAEAVEVHGLRMRPFFVPQQAGQFDLQCDVGEIDGRLAGLLKYNSDLFNPDTAQRICARYERLLRAMCHEPDRSLGELSLATDEEKRFEVDDCNATDVDHNETRQIHRIIEEQVRKYPERVALSFGERRPYLCRSQCQRESLGAPVALIRGLPR